jgi:hypothetical protein
VDDLEPVRRGSEIGRTAHEQITTTEGKATTTASEVKLIESESPGLSASIDEAEARGACNRACSPPRARGSTGTRGTTGCDLGYGTRGRAGAAQEKAEQQGAEPSLQRLRGEVEAAKAKRDKGARGSQGCTTAAE